MELHLVLDPHRTGTGNGSGVSRTKVAANPAGLAASDSAPNQTHLIVGLCPGGGRSTFDATVELELRGKTGHPLDLSAC
jgi:hypothetical protein